jgi:hypothetical protein
MMPVFQRSREPVDHRGSKQSRYHPAGGTPRRNPRIYGVPADRYSGDLHQPAGVRVVFVLAELKRGKGHRNDWRCTFTPKRTGRTLGLNDYFINSATDWFPRVGTEPVMKYWPRLPYLLKGAAVFPTALTSMV